VFCICSSCLKPPRDKVVRQMVLQKGRRHRRLLRGWPASSRVMKLWEEAATTVWRGSAATRAAMGRGRGQRRAGRSGGGQRWRRSLDWWGRVCFVGLRRGAPEREIYFTPLPSLLKEIQGSIPRIRIFFCIFKLDRQVDSTIPIYTQCPTCSHRIVHVSTMLDALITNS
jgi:hypothetical protein